MRRTPEARLARLTAPLLPLALVAACTGPDLTKVPDVAEAPYACDGVPRAGVELLLGGEATVDRTRGAWGDDGTGFNCALSRGDAVVLVDAEDTVSSPLGPTDADVLATMRRAGGTAIEADAPGEGYVWGEKYAGWVCDGRTLVVEAHRVDVEGRDLTADVTRLLESMLPWACEGEDAPPATEE